MKRLILLMMLPLAFAACSNVKKNLGMERSQPDEFAVVERAPLTMPPNFNLMPPQPGAAGPQETKTSATAQSLILGTETGAASTVTKPVNNSSVDNLLSDASNAATKPSNEKTDSAVLMPTEESKRLQQQNIRTTTVPSPVMKNAR